MTVPFCNSKLNYMHKNLGSILFIHALISLFIHALISHANDDKNKVYNHIIKHMMLN